MSESTEIKWYRPLVLGLLDALHGSFVEGYHAEKVLERLFKQNKKWGKRDRAFVAENFYECVRYFRRYQAALGFDGALNPNQLEQLLILFFVDRYGEFPHFLKSTLKEAQLSSALRKGLKEVEELSYPDWFFKRYLEQNEDGIGVLKSLNQPAVLYLRANRLKATPQQVVEQLSDEGIRAEALEDDVLRVDGRPNVFRTDSFKQGLFEVQDRGSQKIGAFCRPQPGQWVLDVCAGAGGKSLHLASMMQNKGKLISSDLHDYKLDELRKRSSRAGVDIIETRPLGKLKKVKRPFDRILLDVPCSGMGVLRRHPDSKWKMTEDKVDELIKTQQEILDRYSSLLSEDGELVYATCSLLKEENDQQVESFLSRHPQWKLQEVQTIEPQDFDCDGFFMARLTR